ncbi:MAG: DUF2126 domain-containing protein [Thioalkalivibrionaceae bacterium]
MAIRVALLHDTHYRFDRPVRTTPHVVRLRPAPHARTPIEAYALQVHPRPHFVHWQQDPFGNFLARVTFPEPVTEMRFTVDLVAEMTVINPFDFFLEPDAETMPFEYPKGLREDLAPYLAGAGGDVAAAVDDVVLDWLATIAPPSKDESTVDFLVRLNQAVHDVVDYTVRMEAGVQSPSETLTLGSGSCRDSAWLLVHAARYFGLAARFVSGYLIQLVPDEKPLDGPAGPAQDFTDLHAWCEVFLPGAGWVGLDATSGLLAGEGHVPLVATPEPSSAAPITGATERCEARLEFRNEIRRVQESPRVTKPYDDAQWAAIDALGEAVDVELDAQDARLTMGGEPTFVSVDDFEAPEWNVAADGPQKRARAQDLASRLLAHFAPGGLLHFGQGKWYPGEALPRWAYTVMWRGDGVPLWRDPRWLAPLDTDLGHDGDAAERFARTLARRLGGEGAERFLQAAYEDPFWNAWAEQNLPFEALPEPGEAALDDPSARTTLARALSHGLDRPRAFALPLAPAAVQTAGSATRWLTGRWNFRGDRLRLLPGDSPAGLRLPLDRIAFSASDAQEAMPERDPFAPRGPLSDPNAVPRAQTPRRVADEQVTGAPSGSADGAARVDIAVRSTPGTPEPLAQVSAADAPAEPFVEAAFVLRTTLCVEARDGRVHVFLPPMPTLEGFVDLVARVEASCRETGLPVVLEGYAPPVDPRLKKLAVTPDPGVIEVNVHPAASWAELRGIVTDLYRLARESRLGAEKFQLDGKHSGTGGGNHVTLGGPTPADSIVLRRPDLLGSLVTYWQHHPGLSYLFSGTFIGPTSQAPRVDEARHENLYELEIALSQMPPGEVAEPWLVDRLFRNLLVDITGNTHRAEFCIDKLYSPDSSSGRLGLLELRAFEMPPHARMSLVQMLLLRALVARFLAQPYRHRLVRWGTALHDRFLLPHYVENDLREVCEDLHDAGFPFAFDWLAPFFAFRFPLIGSVQIGEIELELRHAIEPWHVLGEEATGMGTARYVDSSVERLQVRVTGFSGDRYQIACNGRLVPMRPTRTQGERVAGVRFRAWAPPSALHPRIPAQSPLVFDVIDTWSGRAIGGCRYHVVHPGGRAYDTYPVNAFEAEARRVARFERGFHTPGWPPAAPAVGSVVAERPARGGFEPGGSMLGPMLPPREAPNPEYPHTLDLRHPPEPGL